MGTAVSSGLGAGKYLLYGAGQLGVMLVARYLFQWLVRFSDQGKDGPEGPLLSAALVGALFLAFRIFDAVADPVAGAFGDAWVQKGRERRSLIWPSFALPAVGLLLVFSVTHALPAVGRWLLVGLGLFVFFIGYTLYAIPYWALCEDYAEGQDAVRARLSNMLGAGVLLATAFGFVLSPLLIQRWGFLSGAAVFALLGTVLMVLPYFAAPSHARAVPTPGPQHKPHLREMLRAALTDRAFLALICLYVGSQMSFTVMTAASPYIAEKLLGGTLADVAKLLGPFLLGALLSFTFVPRLSARFGWEKASLWATLALGVAYSGTGLLGGSALGSPMLTAMLVFAAAGPGAAVVLGVEGEAIARLSTESQHRSTALYFGVFNFIVKAMNGVALSLLGVLADIGTKGAVRAMPMMAGGMCLLGVLGYVAIRAFTPRSPRAAPPS